MPRPKRSRAEVQAGLDAKLLTRDTLHTFYVRMACGGGRYLSMSDKDLYAILDLISVASDDPTEEAVGTIIAWLVAFRANDRNTYDIPNPVEDDVKIDGEWLNLYHPPSA